MVKIVRLRTGEERQMVPGVGIQRRQDHQREPQPGDGHVASEHKNTQERWHQVAEDMLDRVTVDGGDGNRSRPLVMLLVDEFVDVSVV